MSSVYNGLGLSDFDIGRLEKYNLTYLLDKIKDQQNELESQKRKLEEALSKIEKDLGAARDAQMSLLPKDIVGVPGLTFSARFYPSQFVSGDIYNIFRLDENHIGVYHIDISGHGVPAALFSVSLSQLLNTNVSKANLLKVPVNEPPYYKINPPNEVIAALDEDNSFKRADVFFTMIYMIINLREKKIHFTRAGHNPPIILKNNNEIIMPRSGGLPVGLGFSREDVVEEIQLAAGDRVFMFSDGITEAANNHDEFFSIERLANHQLATSSLSLDESLDSLIIKLHQFTGSETFEDDVSIIGLCWD